MAERRDEGVLARWSRRKQAARAGEPEQPEDPQLAAAAEEQAPQTRPDAPAIEEPPDLPDPATLDAASDFKPFLKPGVPAETQRAALRRLWRLDPIYNRLDGLDDYCEDFTDQAALKGIRTAYRVGRGLLDQVDKATAAPQTPSAETTESPPDPSEPTAERAPAEAKAKPGAKPRPRARRPLPKRV